MSDPIDSTTNDEVFRQLFIANPLPMWIYDIETLNFLEVNDAAVAQYGYSRTEFLAMTIRDIRPPEDVPRLMDNLRAGRPAYQQSGEWRHRRKDGTIFHVQINSHIINYQGREAVLVMARDITAHFQSEERYRQQLKESIERRTTESYHARQRVEAILNSSSDAIILAHLTEGIQQTNPAFNSLFAAVPDACYGQSLTVLAAPGDAPRLEQALRQVAAGEVVQGLEIQAQCTDGSLFYAEIGLAPVKSYHEPGSFVCNLRDISDRKRSEEQLRESNEKFRLLVESAPEAIVISDATGRIVMVNIEARRLFGYEREEMVGQPVEMLVPAWVRDTHTGLRQNYQARPHSRSMGTGLELLARHKEGREFPVDVALSAVETRSGILVMSFITDITQRRQTEQALHDALQHEKDLGELKSRFVSMASHEFRTPLATILAAAETLLAYRARMDAPQIDHRLQKIRDQVDYLREIIDDVLQLTRMEAGRVDFVPEETDFDEFCRDIVDEFQSRPDMEHRIEYRCTPRPLMMAIDKKLMRPVVANLLQNAIKYSPDVKDVSLDISGNATDVVLTVCDRGIGIPEEDQKHIFEAFHRASNIGTISGTGLGLSIVRQAVELHKGRITFTSQVGQGTCFTITLPLKHREVESQQDPGAKEV